MDPHVVFDCQMVLPDRFALTLAAAARSRALGLGAEPRLELDDASVSDRALREIAAGMFTPSELAPFLSDDGRSLPPPDRVSKFRAGVSKSAAAPASRPRETAH